MWRVGVLACLFAGGVAAQQTTHGLELRLKPGALQNGLPQTLTIELVNTGDHEIRLPLPVLTCEDMMKGSIHLNVAFQPSRPGYPSGYGRGCGGGVYDLQTAILQRVREWRVLAAGDSLTLEAQTIRGIANSFYDEDKPGKYTYSVTYMPPYISDDHAQLLHIMGIDWPRNPITAQLVYTIAYSEP